MVNAVFSCLRRPCGFGRRPGFPIPQYKMFEDLIYDLLILYHAYDLHGSRTFRVGEGINLHGSSTGQAVIFWIIPPRRGKPLTSHITLITSLLYLPLRLS